MKIGLLTSLAVLWFSRAAQASVISETFTGTIVSGVDVLDLFGGDLTGDFLTLSLSYNTGLLINDTMPGTDGSLDYSAGSEEQYYDYAGDGAVSESLTINSQTFAMSSNFNNSLGRVEGGSNASGSGIDNSVFNLTSGAFLDTQLDSTYIYSIGQLLSQNSVTAFVDSSDSGGVALSTDGPAALDVFNLQGVTVVSSTPEPATWISLALGIGVLPALTPQRG